MQNKDAQIRHAQQELLNELSRQIIAGTLELGTEQVIDVLDEPPAPGRSVGGTKIVFRKPIAKETRLREDAPAGKES